MALPVILIDSATGSDSAASGAGPATALTGSAGVSSASGLSVILDGSPDLSGVATDGSHVLYFADATAGNRNFGKITATANSGTPTAAVTVADAFGVVLTKAWAIGGKRASLLSATSAKLIENNSLSGDAMPGWVMQMASGHAETRTTSINPRRAGDTTSGSIILRGVLGAATMPILTFSNNGDAFIPRASAWEFRDFEMQNTNGTKTASICFDCSVATGIIINNVKVNHATNKFNNFIATFGTSSFVIEECNLQNFNGVCISLSSASNSMTRICNNVIALCGAGGILQGNVQSHLIVKGNLIVFNTGDGIHVNDATNIIDLVVVGNVIHGNSGDGIESAITAAHAAMINWLIEDNEITFNGGYGINLSGASMGDAAWQGMLATIRNNAFFTNTLGKYNGITIVSSINEVTTDPSGGLSSATKDYAGVTSGTNFMSSVHKSKGYPIGGTLAVGTGSNSYNYQDIGLGHQDAGMPFGGALGV